MGNVLKPQDPPSVAYERLLSLPENVNLRVFSVKELKKATTNFRKERVVNGEDGSVRTFYKGSIDDTSSRTKTRISVSVMECVQDSLEAIEAWKEEVKSLGSHSHPNIVNFFGYCCEDTKSLLVFEYLHTLDHHIHGTIGIAQGVSFLHSINNSSLCFELRMHNIMLDEEYNAKLFYLEKNKECLENPLDLGRGHIYMPYEWVMTGWFQIATDVYAFGVIMLELFTGSEDGDLRSHITALRDGEKNVKNSFTEAIDPRLDGDYPASAAIQLSTLIQRCTEDKQSRPSMQQVLDALNHIAEIH